MPRWKRDQVQHCETVEKEVRYSERTGEKRAHSACDGLVAPFDLNLFTFKRRFLLHRTRS